MTQLTLTQLRDDIENRRVKLYLPDRYFKEVDAAMDRQYEIYDNTPEGEQATVTHIYWVGPTGDLHVTGDTDDSIHTTDIQVLKIQIHMDEDGDYETVSYLSPDGAPLPEDLQDMARGNELYRMSTDDIQPESLIAMTRAIFNTLGLTPDRDLIKANAVSLGDNLFAPISIASEI